MKTEPMELINCYMQLSEAAGNLGEQADSIRTFNNTKEREMNEAFVQQDNDFKIMFENGLQEFIEILGDTTNPARGAGFCVPCNERSGF